MRRSRSSASEPARPTPRLPHWPFLVLLVAVVVVYVRIFSAGFVSFDDDIHVYANPFLNPPTLQSLGRLWQKAYEGLYVPLAYSIYAAIAGWAQVPAHADASVGHSVSLDPVAFHMVGVGVHVVNALLCFLLVRRLTRRTAPALLSTLVFVLHPLQLESVGWISELRGLSSSTFALLALYALVVSRQAPSKASTPSRTRLAASVVFVACAMLCKPTAAILPLVALALDRTVLGTSWRRALATAAMWATVTVPLGLLTRSIQSVTAAGDSLWWQRPFVAGDALAFYLYKTFVPVGLCVDYGRTPGSVMSNAWGYLAWAVPVGLLVVCYRYRNHRPLTWLGALMFATFLLPTLGLVPFAYQAYSTVADRYAYLALMGVGLMLADTVDHVKPQKVGVGLLCAALAALALLSFGQSRYWLDSSALLRHTIDINPSAAFAYNNLGDIELANGKLDAALADYQSCVAHDPTRVKATINLAEVFTALGQPTQAERAIDRALKTPAMTADDFSNLGIVLMKMNQPERALPAFSTAATMDPSSPTYLFNQANALSAVGQLDKAETTFRQCIALAPTLAGAHTGLGIVLAESHRLAEALDEFRAAVRLQPNDPAALDNLKRAEAMMATQSPAMRER
jgi:protein O-mannosyl-transferase